MKIYDLGFRIVAMPLLSISSSTLIYGSADAGRNVYNAADDEWLSAAVRDAAEYLHLSGHTVKGKTLYSAGDVEIHRISDELYYMIDLARCFPPEDPLVAAQVGGYDLNNRAIFYRKLRYSYD